MKVIEAYKTSDGRLFESESAARENQNNLIGQEVDELIQVLGLDIGHQQKYMAALRVVNDSEQQKKLMVVLCTLLKYLKHGNK